MKIIITGAAGFIGFHVCQYFLKTGVTVIGIDNFDSHYSPELKKARINKIIEHDNFIFIKGNINNSSLFDELYSSYSDAEYVIHLAAQTGVRYSLENPDIYIQSNIVGLFNILEFIKKLPNLKNFIFSSSSSVYGNSIKFPFSVNDKTDSPISIYAATKKSGETIAYSYSDLFKIPTTILRFFTVYGPWGRPDMAPYIFTKCIYNGEKIPLYGNGEAIRSFTYIDDVISGIASSLSMNFDMQNNTPYRILNIGNNKANSLKQLIETIEKNLGKKALLNYMPAKIGDVNKTIADISQTQKAFEFIPKTSLDEGIKKLVKWYKNYHNN